MYRKTRPTRYSFATFLLRIHGRYERTSYLTSLPIDVFMVLRQSASSQESTGCFFDWSLLAVPVILKSELTSKLQIRTRFPDRSYPIIKPDVSGSMIQCSIPTRSPMTGRRSALKWMVIIVSTDSSVYLQQGYVGYWDSQESSPSLSTPRNLLTALLAPSQATTCVDLTIYSRPELRSSTVVST